MKPFSKALKVIALAIGVAALSACASVDASHAQATPGAKLDNGLGELPHYRDWVDPTGRAPTAHVVSAKDSARWP
jgi:hypothetical protein